MGEIKRKRKLYSRPRQIFDKVRIDEENIISKNYGLKAKREIWKSKAVISRFRKLAKKLIGAEEEEKKAFFEKINKMGIVVSDISDVLELTEKDLLERRLQTIVFKKKLATTPQQARQLIVHQHILVDGKVVDVPSFIVTRELESKISLKEKKVKVKPAKKDDAPVAPEEKSETKEETLVEEVVEKEIKEVAKE
jgi:small subunit ribosomal protein S4